MTSNLIIMQLTETEINSLRVAIFNLEKLSREVGYLSALANAKTDDEYDMEAIAEYEKAREKQVNYLNSIIDRYLPVKF